MEWGESGRGKGAIEVYPPEFDPEATGRSIAACNGRNNGKIGGSHGGGVKLTADGVDELHISGQGNPDRKLSKSKFEFVKFKEVDAARKSIRNGSHASSRNEE
ncbi:hypothetical protein U1Q18_037579 [Sarracenia purpurea var. burkii]